MRTRRPTVSLILSLFNQRWCLPSVLASIAEQRTTEPMEVLICDDGSTDDPATEIFEWAKERSVDVRYIWQPDLGFRLSRSRNNAIRCAQGEILIFVDGDTWIEPRFVDQHLSVHHDRFVLGCGARTKVTVNSACSARTVNDIASLALSSHVVVERTEQQQWVSSDQPWMSCLGGNFSVPFVPDLEFDEDFEGWGSEDRDIALRLCRSGIRPVLLPCVNAVHLTRAGCADYFPNGEAIAATLRGKLHLRQKYPGGELDPSLEVVRCFHYNRETRQWSLGAPRTDKSALEILNEFQSLQLGH